MTSLAFSDTIISGSLSGTMPAYYSNAGCAPLSIVEVLAYWDIQYNMPNMFPVSKANLLAYVGTNIDTEITSIATIANICQTDGSGGTLLAYIGPGLVTYSGSMGYALSATTTGNIISDSGTTHMSQIKLTVAWNNLVSNINANRPMLLYVDENGDGTADHIVPAIAYSNNYNGLGINCYEYVNDGATYWSQFQLVASGNSFGVANEIMIVPEPTTFIFLLSGIGFFFLFRGRKRHFNFIN